MSTFMHTGQQAGYGESARRLRVDPRAIGLLAAGLLACAALPGLTGGSGAPVSRQRASAGPSTASITLHGTRVHSRYGYLTVAGEVENTSAGSLRNVEAVAELFDSRGRLLQVESALLTSSRVAPRDASSFAIHCRDAAAAASYRVIFRTIDGAPLSMRVESP